MPAHQVTDQLDMYPSEMWKLYRYETHVGKALFAALEEMTSSKTGKSLRMSKEEAHACVQSFDKTVVKYLRTEAPEEPYILEAEHLVSYRIMPNRHLYLLKDVSIIRCLKPVTVQWWVREQKWTYGPGFGDNNKNLRTAKKLPQSEINRRLNLMKNHFFKLKVEEADLLKIVCDNPFKGGQVRVAACPKSRGGIQTDELLNRYSYEQIRTPTALNGEYDPYKEYMYREKLPKVMTKEEKREVEKQTAERKLQEKIQNIPLRFRNSHSYKKFLTDTGHKDEDGVASDESLPSTVKAPSAVSKRTISSASSSTRPSYKTSYETTTTSPLAKGGSHSRTRSGGGGVGNSGSSRH